MLVLLGMKDAGEKAFSRGKGNMHVLISGPMQDPMVTVLNSIFYSGSPRTYMPASTQQYLLDNYPLAWAIPTQLGDSFRGLPVMATSPEFFTQYQPIDGRPWSFASGRAFSAPFELVAGAEAARLTGLSVGDTLSVSHGTPKKGEDAHVHDEFVYTVVGILDATSTLHDRAVFTDLASAWTLHAHDRRLGELGHDTHTTPADLLEEDKKVTGYYSRVLTRPGMGVSAIFQSAFNSLRNDPRITVAAPDQEIGKLFRIVSNIDQIILALAATVLVVGSITIMLVLYQAMEQRRRHIAVLRVLGCSRSRVFGLIVTESAVIGAAGAALGVAFSLVGMRVVADILYQRLGLIITPGFEPKIVLVLSLGTVALASIAGIVPAVSAYRTSVVKNLRPSA